MSGLLPRFGMALGAVLFLCLHLGPVMAEEDKKDPENTEAAEDEAFIDEFPDEEEADFPTLVGVDETGGFMDELMFLEEESVVELPARHAQAIGMSPSAVWVITREDIETSGANRLADLLRMVPGMEVLYVSSFYSAVTARLVWGYTNNTLLMLVDGREANMEFIGQAIWEGQVISMEDIERIEVIRGPGAALYGANAVSGVVSITTRKIPDETSARAGIAAGQPSLLRTGLQASTRIGPWGFSFSADFDAASAMTDPAASRKEAGKFRLVADLRLPEDMHLLLDAGIFVGTGPVTTAFGDIHNHLFFGPTRLAFRSETVQAQIAYTPILLDSSLEAPITYAGIYLADFADPKFWIHSLDGKAQWTLPTLWDPLLLIVGGRLRTTFTSIDRALNYDTFADPDSPNYHKEGSFLEELRAGTYLHAELSAAEWITLTGGLRVDYNNITELFLSPRLAAVIQPAKGHFFRLAASRAFRMPSVFESSLHMAVDFPEASPFKSESQRNAFRDFATRILGNPNVDDEKVLAFEAGYRGEFLDGRLSVSLELYRNSFTDQILLFTDITTDSMGLPDLRSSTAWFINTPKDDLTMWGSELAVRYSPKRTLSFLASWTHREVTLVRTGETSDASPKNYLTLGGRFRSEGGWLGSLYLFGRSEFTDYYVSSPYGIMEPYWQHKMNNVLLIMARLAQSWSGPHGLEMEAGIRLTLPIDDPFGSPRVNFQEKGGGETVFGQRYAGDELRQAVTFYLQGKL